MTAARDGEPVGSLAAEAARLVEALQDWAGAAGAEHVATGNPECAYCPVCRVVGAVRATSPEVRRHLASAATSLARAVAAMLATEPDTGRATEPVDDEQEDA